MQRTSNYSGYRVTDETYIPPSLLLSFLYIDCVTGRSTKKKIRPKILGAGSPPLLGSIVCVRVPKKTIDETRKVKDVEFPLHFLHKLLLLPINNRVMAGR